MWRTGLVAPRHVGSSRPGLEPASPALADGFLTTVPPGKSYYFLTVDLYNENDVLYTVLCYRDFIITLNTHCSKMKTTERSTVKIQLPVCLHLFHCLLSWKLFFVLILSMFLYANSNKSKYIF